jgi:hypothetical protein
MYEKGLRQVGARLVRYTLNNIEDNVRNIMTKPPDVFCSYESPDVSGIPMTQTIPKEIIIRQVRDKIKRFYPRNLWKYIEVIAQKK